MIYSSTMLDIEILLNYHKYIPWWNVYRMHSHQKLHNGPYERIKKIGDQSAY